MSDHMRKMLDELMGTQRDGVVDERQTRFNDSVVCKSFLVGLCPYDLFHNTGTFKSSKKLDLGVCSKVHDPALKADYEQAAKTKEYNYEIEQFDAIRQFVADCERKVTLNKKRLEETQDAESLCPEALAVHTLNEQIGKKLAEAEQLGVEGNIEESMKAAEEVEQLKADKKKAEEVFRSNAPAATNQQQKLRVCDICAAFLSLYDNDRRLADHFGGRLHMGFIQVRERLEELEKMMKDRPDYLQKVEQEKIRERSERSSRSERERSRERSRRRRSRSRDRDSRRKHRSRSHEHCRGRHRRSRSRDRRSHSREQHSRSRDRRSRSRERRSRSREPREARSDRREEPKEPSTSDERLNDTMEDGEVVEEANGSPAALVTKSADEIYSKCRPSSMPLDQIPTHNEFDERAAT